MSSSSEMGIDGHGGHSEYGAAGDPVKATTVSRRHGDITSKDNE